MQTLTDYHVDALFRSVLADEAETLAPAAATESQMLERVRQALRRRRSRRQLATLSLAAALLTLTAGAIALASNRLTPVPPDPPLVLPTSSAPPSSSPASSSSLPSPTYSGMPDAFVPNPIPLHVDLPPEWTSHFGTTSHRVWARDGLTLSEIGFYIIDNLLAEPCRPERGYRDPPIGSSAADLVTALSSLPAYQNSTTDDVVLGGLPATRITVPHTLRSGVGSCDDVNALNGGHSHDPDEVAGLLALAHYGRVWIADVDDRRLVVVAEGPRSDEIEAVIDSIRFDP